MESDDDEVVDEFASERWDHKELKLKVVNGGGVGRETGLSTVVGEKGRDSSDGGGDSEPPYLHYRGGEGRAREGIILPLEASI